MALPDAGEAAKAGSSARHAGMPSPSRRRSTPTLRIPPSPLPSLAEEEEQEVSPQSIGEAGERCLCEASAGDTQHGASAEEADLAEASERRLCEAGAGDAQHGAGAEEASERRFCLPASPRQAVASEAFRIIDKNGNGSLSRIEVILACRRDPSVRALLGLPATIRQEDGSRDRFEQVFQAMDSDDSKDVDFEEFARFVAEMQQTGDARSKASANHTRCMALWLQAIEAGECRLCEASTGDSQHGASAEEAAPCAPS